LWPWGSGVRVPSSTLFNWGFFFHHFHLGFFSSCRPTYSTGSGGFKNDAPSSYGVRRAVRQSNRGVRKRPNLQRDSVKSLPLIVVVQLFSFLTGTDHLAYRPLAMQTKKHAESPETHPSLTLSLELSTNQPCLDRRKASRSPLGPIRSSRGSLVIRRCDAPAGNPASLRSQERHLEAEAAARAVISCKNTGRGIPPIGGVSKPQKCTWREFVGTAHHRCIGSSL
jgi:hypothetical protein